MNKEWFIEQFGETWYWKLKDYLETEEFKVLGNTIAKERKTKNIYPSSDLIFRCFRETPFNKVRVVILGQDPYFTKNTADGLAFSCKKATGLNPLVKVPPSLVQIMETVERTAYKGLMLNKDFDLQRWANQGILLLNTSLTVEEGKPESHLHLWRNFTKQVIKSLNDYNTGVIYCLWGSKAQEYKKYINEKFNYVMLAKHPASASYNKCIWECDHFVEINKILKANNNEEIIW